MKKRVFILLLVILNIVLSVSSYAEVQNVYLVAEEKAEIYKPTITISLDLIECAPQKLTEYGINYPETQSSTIQEDKDIRDKLSRLKKDKDIKILYSTKVTTYPGNKVVIDNRQPIEYLVPEEKNGATNFKREIAYTGNLFEANPTITKDGDISFDYYFWVCELKGRFSNNKDIPAELGYPAVDSRSSKSGAILKDGETIIQGGMVKNTQKKSHTNAGDITKEERKALIICLGADINYAQNIPK